MPQLERTHYPTLPPTATVLNIERDSDWGEIERLVMAHVVEEADKPFRQILDVVRSRGCSTVVIEHRYIDRDYLSEYSSFWSGRFNDHRPETKRIHFFKTSFAVEDLLFLPKDPGYLGYCVIRPTYLGALGRTWERRLAVAPARRLEVAPLRVGWCVLLIFSD